MGQAFFFTRLRMFFALFEMTVAILYRLNRQVSVPTPRPLRQPGRLNNRLKSEIPCREFSSPSASVTPPMSNHSAPVCAWTSKSSPKEQIAERNPSISSPCRAGGGTPRGLRDCKPSQRPTCFWSGIFAHKQSENT